jgi:hypothetical protein
MNVRSRMVIGSAVLALVGLISSPPLLFGSDQLRAKDIIQQTCVQCHRLEGTVRSCRSFDRAIPGGLSARRGSTSPPTRSPLMSSI